MQDLFRAEWLRFYRWALSLTLMHAGWLIFVDRVADPLQQPSIVYQVYLGIVSLLGVFFGLYQVSAYAPQTAWIDLLHRPVSPGRIGTALMLAGLALVGVVIALPVIVLLPFHQFTAGQGVESRHFLFPLAAWALGAAGYLLGVYLRLGPPRLAWAALILLVWLYQAQASGPAAVGLQLLVVGLSFLLALGTFRPDRLAPEQFIRKIATSSLVALTIGVCGTFALRFAIQLAMMLLGNHPLNGVPPQGGLVEAMRSDGAGLVVNGLASQHSERNRFWIEQAGLSEIVTIFPELREPTQRYSLMNPGENTIEDSDAHLSWSFSHDTMRYAATDRKTRKPWRPDAIPPELPAPPLVGGDGGAVISGNQILRYDALTRNFAVRIALPPDERLMAPPQPAWNKLLILSDKSLRVYDGRVMQYGDNQLPPLSTIKLFGSPSELVRIDMLELLDGYLVSFTYGQNSVDGRSLPQQQIWQVEGSRVLPVLTRPLDPDYPAVMRYANLWFAPALTATAVSLRNLWGAPNNMARTGSIPIPSGIIALALLLHLTSGLVAWRRGKTILVDRRERYSWALAALLLGPPMLIAFLLMHRRKPT